MKKLLSTLSILTLSSTATFGVVSCKTTQNKPKNPNNDENPNNVNPDSTTPVNPHAEQQNKLKSLTKQLQELQKELEFNQKLLDEINTEINQNNPTTTFSLLSTSKPTEVDTNQKNNELRMLLTNITQLKQQNDNGGDKYIKLVLAERQLKELLDNLEPYLENEELVNQINQLNQDINHLVDELSNLNLQIQRVQQELQAKIQQLQQIQQQINTKISQAKEVFAKYVNKVWDDEIASDTWAGWTYQDIFNRLKEKGKQYTFFNHLTSTLSNSQSKPIVGTNNNKTFDIKYKNNNQFKLELKFKKVWPEKQNAQYRNDECIEIGYDENGKIKQFNTETKFVPTHLPKFITSLEGAFRANKNSEIKGIEKWNTSNVTNMSKMFIYSYNFNQDISKWNTSNVTDMSEMFEMSKNFNQNINTKKVTREDGSTYIAWNTSNVVDMSGMFYEAKSFNQDISNWNVSNVTDMSGMFFAALAFNRPLNNWNTSNVTNMNSMFKNARKFNQPLNKWDTSNVTRMWRMFADAKSFNQPLNTWNTSNVTDMKEMFQRAKPFNQPLSNWNTENVTDMSFMFSRAEEFNQDISKWDVSQVINSDFFSSDSNSNWKTEHKPKFN
ncbi:BspA family leucine-rich repeat surface protein [Mycoplasma sp. HU2014]|uniref:BspA family leucine-rich repeat surface protein n=1 Tax=Mycoplasma sp. HU2014 TaxID=1664275 RepID=UPI0006A4125E|nr:BspA family leucine-rich repeat surface protein [Mycoplasma sp. HU2014]KNG78960.1 PARCEL domain-containing lipoprotein [Mycoplasma sp. HU2014]